MYPEIMNMSRFHSSIICTGFTLLAMMLRAASTLSSQQASHQLPTLAWTGISTYKHNLERLVFRKFYNISTRQQHNSQLETESKNNAKLYLPNHFI